MRAFYAAMAGVAGEALERKGVAAEAGKADAKPPAAKPPAAAKPAAAAEEAPYVPPLRRCVIEELS